MAKKQRRRKRTNQSRGEEIKELERQHGLMKRDLTVLASYLDKWIECGRFPKPSQPISPVDVALILLERYWHEAQGRWGFRLWRLEIALAWRGKDHDRGPRGPRFLSQQPGPPQSEGGGVVEAAGDVVH